MRVWDLDDFKLVRKVDLNEFCCLKTLPYHDRLVLAYRDRDGFISFLDSSDLYPIDWYHSTTSKNSIDSFEAIRYKDKVCLIYPGGNNTMEIWNIEDKTVMATLDVDVHVSKIKAFMHDGKACLLTA